MFYHILFYRSTKANTTREGSSTATKQQVEMLRIYQNRTGQNRTLLKTMHLRPLTGGVRDKHKHVMQ